MTLFQHPKRGVTQSPIPGVSHTPFEVLKGGYCPTSSVQIAKIGKSPNPAKVFLQIIAVSLSFSQKKVVPFAPRKVLAFGKTQINLVFLSFIRTFASVTMVANLNHH